MPGKSRDAAFLWRCTRPSGAPAKSEADGIVLRARAFPGDPLKVGLGIVPWFRAPSPPWQRPFRLQLDLLYRLHRCGCLRAAPPRCRAAGPPGCGRISRLRLLGRSGRLANCERVLRHRRQAWHGDRVRDENVRYCLADRSKWRKRPLEGRDGCLQHPWLAWLGRAQLKMARSSVSFSVVGEGDLCALSPIQ